MALVAALIAVASAILPFTGKRLLLITALGVTGAGVSLIFALYGAIDVAITQLMVETLVVVIIAVALLKLPPITLRREAAARRRRAWNIGISTVLGVASTFAVLTVMQGDIDLKITKYFEETSATVAHGRNIVNVILVDFRALDTMGEIAVVAIAGLAALALLAVKTRPLKDIDE
jgi:multicomponent Na+:H+ antiporter subunit A